MALPIIGAVVIWDPSGVFYWTRQVVAIYNAPGFLSVSGMLTFVIISFGILFVIGIVSDGAEWVLKHIVLEWFRGSIARDPSRTDLLTSSWGTFR